jgi:hypothetical protein
LTRATTLPECVVEYLETGIRPRTNEWPAEVPKLRLFVDYLLKADWEAVRDELLEAWIQREPGTRPWAWWRFEMPKDKRGQPDYRRHVGGSGREGAFVQDFGIRGCFDCSATNPPLVESEAAYLQRHGLLVQGEERRLRAKDLRPVPLSVDEGGDAPDAEGEPAAA